MYSRHSSRLSAVRRPMKFASKIICRLWKCCSHSVNWRATVSENRPRFLSRCSPFTNRNSTILFQLIFVMQLVRWHRWKASAWISVMLDGSRHQRNWPERYSPRRCNRFNRKKSNRIVSMVKPWKIDRSVPSHTNSQFNLCRGNISRHSSRRALVRTMAWDFPVSARTVGPRIHATLLELSHRLIEFGSESIGHGKCVDAEGSNDAKCDAAEAAEMVHHRHTELLRFVAWSQPQWPYQVGINFFFVWSVSTRGMNLLNVLQCPASIRDPETSVWRRQMLSAPNQFAAESRAQRQYWSVAEVFAPANEECNLPFYFGILPARKI